MKTLSLMLIFSPVQFWNYEVSFGPVVTEVCLKSVKILLLFGLMY